MTGRELKDRLSRRARRAGVFVSGDVADKLEAYYRLLTLWNKSINLTGFDLEEGSSDALDRLLVEPLVAAKLVSSEARQALDVGSGGGSPAIPMLLATPGLRLLMVESKTRKSVFLAEAIRTLELANAEVVVSRFEELLTRPDLHEKHDLLTIRAVRMEPRTLMGLQAFLKPSGKVFLFRGSVVGGITESVHPPLAWRGTFPLVESQRSRLVVLEKVGVGDRRRST